MGGSQLNLLYDLPHKKSTNHEQKKCWTHPMDPQFEFDGVVVTLIFGEYFLWP